MSLFALKICLIAKAILQKKNMKKLSQPTYSFVFWKVCDERATQTYPTTWTKAR